MNGGGQAAVMDTLGGETKRYWVYHGELIPKMDDMTGAGVPAH